MLAPGTLCANCLHPFASHYEEGCKYNVNCPCLGFEVLEPEKDIIEDHCCGGCDCSSGGH